MLFHRGPPCSAWRLTHTLWGGRFNPIVMLDREDEARRLINLFRVDLIMVVGDPKFGEAFTAQFPHLRRPFLSDRLVAGDGKEGGRAQRLDVHNALVQLQRARTGPGALKAQDMWTYRWETDDPLADVFLQEFGAFPSPPLGIDYARLVNEVLAPTEQVIDPAVPIPSAVLEHPTVADLSRYRIARHYGVGSGWDDPGFFLGDASSIDDLVCCWNLRAADIALWFVDPKHLGRYCDLIPAQHSRAEMRLARRQAFDRAVAVWWRAPAPDRTVEAIGALPVVRCPVTPDSWNGLNIRPPTMHLDQVAALGVVGHERGTPKVSFALNDKPFADDPSFHTQHLVASLSFLGGLHGDEAHTLYPPFIPELNRFYGKAMHFRFDHLRSEPCGVDLVINATEKDAFLKALPIADGAKALFGLAGLDARPSQAGLIVRQLIGRLGGAQGGRVLKIPGVRRLLKTHGPNTTITRKGALQVIGGKGAGNGSSFKAHASLYIEPRPSGGELDVPSVFEYLVDKGLYRLGAKLTCPSCRLTSWLGLDALKEQVVCDLCGDVFRTTRQLVGSEFQYRRSGVFGVERNAQGAVPVALTLQQLHTSVGGGFCTSVEVRPAGAADGPMCEVDFVWIVSRAYPSPSAVILGECKDQGSLVENIEKLGRVAMALESDRVVVFVLLAKLSAFTEPEIALARSLNAGRRLRAILLTDEQLEPYDIYDHVAGTQGVDRYDRTPEGLARMTERLYFD